MAGVVQAAQLQHFSASAEGRITIGPDGQVDDVRFDNADWMDDRVREGYEQKIRAWRFEPIIEGGQPIAVTANVHLRLAAERENGASNARFMIEEVTFPDPAAQALEQAQLAQADFSVRPRFPGRAARNGVGAMAFVVARMGEAGVPDAVGIERIVLRGSHPGAHQAYYARLFSDATMKAAQAWRFGYAKPGELVRIPVKFIPPQATPRLGWEQVFPVPQELPEWLVLARAASTPVADLAENGSRATAHLKMLTPVDG